MFGVPVQNIRVINTQALCHSRDKQLKELSQVQEKGSGLEFSVEEVTGVYHLEFTTGIYETMLSST